MSLVINLKTTDTGLVLRSENTTRFYKDIRKYNVMQRKEENEWFKMLSEAKEKIVDVLNVNDISTLKVKQPKRWKRLHRK